MDHQKELDKVYIALVSGEISRQSYFTQINNLAAQYPSEIASRFNYRKDKRSLGHFSLMLFDNTLREKFLLDQCWKHIARSGDRVEDLGVNNDGRLVLNPRGQNRKMDFLIVGDEDSYPLEVKYCPTQKFATYKVDDLANYLSTPCSKVLTVFTTGQMVGSNGNPDKDVVFELPRHSFFTVMDHDAIGRLLAIGENGNHAGFGGKPTVRIYERQFSQVFDIRAFEGVSCG